MRRQRQSAGFVPLQAPQLAAPGVDGGSGQTPADPIDPNTKRVMEALSRPGVTDFSGTANPGALNRSVTANPGAPSYGSALSSLQVPPVGQPSGAPGAVPGLGDAFAATLAAAQQRAQALMQAQPRIFGGDGGDAGTAPAQYYIGG